MFCSPFSLDDTFRTGLIYFSDNVGNALEKLKPEVSICCIKSKSSTVLCLHVLSASRLNIAALK